MLARINPFATKQRRDSTFLFLNGFSVLRTTVAKAGIAENSDTAENLLAATRIANLVSFTLPYIERMMESQLVEGSAQRIANHLYTALVFGAATATYTSWGLSMRLFEISLTGAATAMKYIAKCVSADTKLADLLTDLAEKIEGTKRIENEDRRAGHADGLYAAIDSINAYFPRSTEAQVSPERPIAVAADRASATAIYNTASTVTPPVAARAVEQKNEHE
jgi:hypothetical protein